MKSSATVLRNAVRRTFARLLRDCRANVAIEFGFVLPIMCMMTFALYEVTEGVICYMKVVDVANTVSDLIGQQLTSATGIGTNEFTNYYTAGQLVMTPSSGSNLGLAVASVYYNAVGGSPVTAWQITRGGASTMSNPTTYISGLGTANGSTVVVQATYTYTSALNYFITTPIRITATVTGQPRNFLPGSGYLEGIPCPPTNGSEGCT
jgi:Flp pilus assembly protein TadG